MNTMSLNVSELDATLQLRREGWWAPASLSDVSYPEEGNAWCFEVEDSSFWFRHRNECILAALENFPPAGCFVDVGGGNGYVAAAIQRAGHPVALVEPGLSGARNALARGVSNVIRASLQDLALPAGSIPAVGLFDVLEHIPDDAEFLRLVHRTLADEGRIYLTVPAHSWLWSHEDVIAGHSRRYTLARLCGLLEATGYTVEFSTYFFTLLLLPILLFRALPFRLGLGRAQATAESINADHVPNAVARLLLNLLSRSEPRRIGGRRCIPFGASCLLVARKRRGSA